MVKFTFLIILVAICGLAVAVSDNWDPSQNPSFAVFSFNIGATYYDRQATLYSVKAFEDGTLFYTEGNTSVVRRTMTKTIPWDMVAGIKQILMANTWVRASSPSGNCIQLWANKKDTLWCDHSIARDTLGNFTSTMQLILELPQKFSGSSLPYLPSSGWLQSFPFSCSGSSCQYYDWGTDAPAYSSNPVYIPGKKNGHNYAGDAWNAMNRGKPIRRGYGTYALDRVVLKVSGLSVLDPGVAPAGPTPVGPIPVGPTPYTYRAPNSLAWVWVLVGLGIFLLLTVCGVIARAMARQRRAAQLGEAYEFQDDSNDEFPGASGDNSVPMQSWNSTASAPTATNVPSYTNTQMPVYMGTNQYGQPVMYTVVPASYTMTQAPVYVQPQDAMTTYAYYVPTATNQ